LSKGFFFYGLKIAMVIEPVLKLPEFDKPFSGFSFAFGRDLDGLSTFPVGDANWSWLQT